MSNEARARVENILNAARMTFRATYRGESKRGDWQCDAWQAVFAKRGGGSIEFDYFTGLGRRKPPKGLPSVARCFPVAPHAADVLYSAMLDASACEMSFRDWCAEYGYNDDSMKDFATYTACCESGEKLRRFFTHEQREQFRAILEDY